MHVDASTRMGPWVGVRATLTRRDRRFLAGLLIGLLLAGSLGYLATHRDPFAFASDPAPGDGRAPMAAGRDPLLWPFSRDSIWNLPIGANTVYVHASIKRSTAYGMTTDPDVLILTPNAPMTPVYYNDDAWNTIPGRCNAEGGALFTSPIPTDFVVLGNGMGGPHGVTPNYATAILAPDGMTLYQGQPFAHCSNGGAATMWWFQTNERLDGRGRSGAHGGSMLSSIGGTIRLGELVPGGVIRHAMKLNMNGDNFYPGLGAYRWPAYHHDACAPGCYTGTNPATRMGSLLALKPDFNFNQLETEPAKILARAFIDYGAYIADNAGWSVYGIDTEFSPSGDVMVEFQNRWGFPIDPPSKDVPWARDMDDIFLNLHVVDNWDEAQWNTVAASSGSLGVGGGAPRVAWAPEIGVDTTPPDVQATVAGTAGVGTWYVSPVSVTVSATDAGSGVASIQIRRDGGAWGPYTSPVTVAGEGSHTVEYYATDTAGNVGTTQSKTFSIDTISPVTITSIAGTAAPGGGYISPAMITLGSADATSGVATVQYRIDLGAWRSYTGPVPLAGNGTHILESFALDHAGNREATRTETVTLTGAAWSSPVTTMSTAGTSGTNGWYVSPVTVTLSATSEGGSPTTISYSLDNAPWTTYGGSFQVAEGRHFLAHQAFDASGYYGPAKSETVVVDWTAPTLAASSGNLVIHPDTSLVWIGSDALSGIAAYEASIDGGTFGAIGTEPQIAGPWSVGSHSVVVRAIDGAGNAATMTIAFRVDPDVPTAPSPPQPSPTIPVPLNLPPGGSLVIALTCILVTVTGLIVRRMRMDRAAYGRRGRSRRSEQRPSDWDWSESSPEMEDEIDLPL